MPRPKKDNKAKRAIGKPAIRKSNAKIPITMPDLSKIATLSHDQGTQCPLNNKSRANLGSAPLICEGSAGSSCALTAEAPTTALTNTAPLTTGATGELISTAATVASLAGPSSIPVTNNDMPSPIPTLTINTVPAPSDPAMEKSEGSKKPNNQKLPSPEDKAKQQRGKIETGENLVPQSPLRRLRKPPIRFDTTEPEQNPKKKSIFEVISRDTLQKYMAHYNIPKRQDLKKNLVTRVQAHFNTIDHEDINLEELTNSVRARLHKLSAEGQNKRKG